MATTSRVKVVRSAAGGSKHPRTRRRDVAALRDQLDRFKGG